MKKKKSKQEERDEILARLAQLQNKEDSQYFKSSAKLGQQRDTKKEALRRALAEERVGLERSAPEIGLYEERDQIVDLTVPRPMDTAADEFIAEHADLLKKKKKKAKKPKAPTVANPTRSLKKKLFTLIEDSDSDSEGHVRRKKIREAHANDSGASISSSVSDIESDDDEKKPTQKAKVVEVEEEELTPLIPAAVVAPHAATRAPKTRMSTASSTKRAMDRKQSQRTDGEGEDNEIEETAPVAPLPVAKGFSFPDFSKTKAKTTQSIKPAKKSSLPAASSKMDISEDGSGSGSESEDDEESENADNSNEESGEYEESGESEDGDEEEEEESDQEEKEMRKKHGLTPAREQKDFVITTDENRPDIRSLDAPAPKAQRDAKQVKTRYFVEVKRSPEIEESRRQLPILMEEHQIMDTIRDNDFVIICGETGSGKTTQVPQFLYEAGFGDPRSKTPGMIGVTEPRRVAAISTSQRVARELNQIIPGLETGENGETKEIPNSAASTDVSSDPSKTKGNKKESHGPTTQHVAYQVRYDVTSDRNTRIKFMTDGILLREIQSDFLLKRYSAIVIDEAHERTMNTDLLLGLLCRIVPLRKELFAQGSHDVGSPLKVVIMSATLRVSDFVENQRMFPGLKPPVIKIGARQFPVTVHFNRRTSLDNYVGDAYKKVIKIHTSLPSGGILVFLAGQAEIVQLVRMLRMRLEKNLDGSASTNFDQDDDELANFDFDPAHDDLDLDDESDESEESLDEESEAAKVGDKLKGDQNDSGSGSDDEDDENEESDGSVDLGASLKPKKISASPSASSSDTESPGSPKMDTDEGNKNENENDESENKKKKKKHKKLDEYDKMHLNDDMKVVVMPLYSMLPPKEQMRIFSQIDDKTRLIVVATNIAETSLTIPGITYVVDAGRVKSKVFDKASGMTSYKVDWTSRASADQRAGRAGRTGPGHCYRLFSSAVYQRFPQFAIPDILNIPIEGVVLQMKQIGIDHLENFPFPTPPDTSSLSLAHRTLRSIGALETPIEELDEDSKNELKITALGRALVNFPVAPRYAKMLIIAHQSDCLDWVVAIVAALAVGSPFIQNLDGGPRGHAPEPLWKQWASNTSDLLVWLAAIAACEYSSDQEAFCEKYKLHHKTMREIRLLRAQLTGILHTVFRSSSDLENGAEIKTLEEDIDAEENELRKKLKEQHEAKGSQNGTKKFQKPKKPIFEAKLPKPTDEQNLKIRQIIASGLLDQTAKRYPQVDDQGQPLKNRWIYRTATTMKECKLHSSSFLRFDPPEYVAYNELIDTAEAFLCGVTAVRMGWMSDLAPWLCKKMDVYLDTPQPRFDESSDTIIAAVQPYFYHSDWIVPKLMVPMTGLELYKHFARTFLEGGICPIMKQFQPFLNANPEAIFKVWTQQKMAALVQPFMDRKIRTREHLFTIWREKDATFLLSAVALWIDKSKHASLKAIWPPLPTKPSTLKK